MKLHSIWIILFACGITGCDTQFEGGSGTENNPYQVATLEQLQAIGEKENLNKHFIQVDNIDASDTKSWNYGRGFTPIGDEDRKFLGGYDGDEYEIEGLYINRENQDNVGLFGYVMDATVKNVRGTDFDIKGDRRVGAVVGYLELGNIEDVFADGRVIGSSRIGGIVGANHVSEVKKSQARVKVKGDSQLAGGLVGLNQKGEVSHSAAYGNISGDGTYHGGLIGNTEEGEVRYSYAMGDVEATRDGLNYSHVGGLMGSSHESEIYSSYATGDVHGKGNFTGGLVGESNRSRISYSYATGKVKGEGSQVGGLIGMLRYGRVFKSYAAGAVSGQIEVGGLIGTNIGEIANSYWNIEASGENQGVGNGNSDGVTGLMTSDMTGQNAYFNMSDLDFGRAFQTTNSYPELIFDP